MTYSVEIAAAAIRQLKRLERQDLRRVQAAIELLKGEPRPRGAKRLSGGDDEWRVRTGNFRIIYTITERALRVLVVAVGHRRDIYGRN